MWNEVVERQGVPILTSARSRGGLRLLFFLWDTCLPELAYPGLNVYSLEYWGEIWYSCYVESCVLYVAPWFSRLSCLSPITRLQYMVE